MGMAEDSRWKEGEKAFPFKKRRSGGYDWGDAGGESVEEKKKNMRSKVKRNTSNKYEEEEEEDDDDDGDDDYNDEEERAAAKNQVMIRRKGRKAAGGLLKRGSRCSRVNGRGWQCSRQTLAGYSLCEHHLGKGRTKSIGSMVGIRRSAAVSGPSGNNNENGDDNDYDLSRPLLVKEATLAEDDEQKEEEAMAWPLLPMMVVKKKKRGRRLGWKRSDNSFLGQAHKRPKM